MGRSRVSERHFVVPKSRRKHYRSGLASAVAILAVAGFVYGAVAHAEDWKEPPRKFVDPLGIDMSETTIPRDDTFLTIGDPSAGGLSWTFHSHYTGAEGDYRGAIGAACTDPPSLWDEPDCDTSLNYILVWIGEGATSFSPNGSGGFDNWSGTGSTLSLSGTTYTYTEGDGTVYTIGTGGLTSIKHPNGMLVTINYVSGSPVSAVSNTGFALKIVKGSGENGDVYGVNTLAHSCDATVQTCSAYDNHIILGPDTGTSYNFKVTDSSAKNWEYLISRKFSYADPHTMVYVRGPRTLWAFKDPTGYAFSSTRGTRGGLTGFTDPRGTFAYSGQAAYAEPSDSYYGTTKDPSGAVIYTANMNEGFGSSSIYNDALGRGAYYDVEIYDHGTSTNTFLPIAPYSRVISKTNPEGDYVTYTYDTRGNVTSAVMTGKSGSGLSETFLANYPSTCTNQVTCNKPTWTKDAKGNETDYTYDATHGGVLTVTLPADQNGLRKRTYNTYETYNTGNGNIYRLIESDTCGLSSGQLTLTACPTGPGTENTTSVVKTSYGTSSSAPYTYKSFQPYSVTQTDGNNSLTATTTYTYDAVGNVIAIDGPRIDVVDISYKTYDANRRVVCEIAPDPDAGGLLVRAMTRHTYDDAGRETKTEIGTGTSTTDCTPGTSMTVASFKRMTYDAAGQLVKTEAVLP